MELPSMLSAAPLVHKSLAAARESGVLGGVSVDRRFKREFRGWEYALLGAMAIALHWAVLQYWSALREHAPIVPPKAPPQVEIELIRPPVVPEIKPEPPKPLPPAIKPEPPKPAPPRPAQPPKPKVVKPQSAPPPKLPPPKPVARAPTPEAPVLRPAPLETPTPAPAAPAEAKVTEPSAGAAYLHNPPPEYPEVALENGWEGKVWLRVHVRPDGKPDQVEVKTSSGRDLLDAAAVQTVRRWTFVPAMRGQTPIAGWVTVPITFKLND